DQRHERPTLAIRVFEGAAPNERDAYGAEVIGRRRTVVGHRRRIWWQTGDRQAACAVARKKGQTARGAYGPHARNTSERFERPIPEHRFLMRRRVAPRSQADR